MSFWKKLAKIAAIAAPIAAAPFTGGLSLAAIGAGAGAASGALNGGGVKGALLGAGMGAIPLGGAGAAGTAAKGATGVANTGMKSALMKAVTSPTMAKVIGAVAAGGSTLGAMGDARAAGREREAASNLQSDELRQRAEADRQKALLDASKQKTDAQVSAGDLDLKQKQFGLDRQGQTLSNIIMGGVANRAQDTTMNRPKGVPTMSFSGGLRPSLIGAAGREAGAEMERRGLLDMMNPEAMAALPTANPEVTGPFNLTPKPEGNALDTILNTAGTVGGVSVGIQNAQDAIKKLLAEKNNRAMRGASPDLTPVSNMASLPGAAMPTPQAPAPPAMAQFPFMPVRRI